MVYKYFPFQKLCLWREGDSPLPVQIALNLSSLGALKWPALLEHQSDPLKSRRWGQKSPRWCSPFDIWCFRISKQSPSPIRQKMIPQNKRTFELFGLCPNLWKSLNVRLLNWGTIYTQLSKHFQPIASCSTPRKTVYV